MTIAMNIDSQWCLLPDPCLNTHSVRGHITGVIIPCPCMLATGIIIFFQKIKDSLGYFVPYSLKPNKGKKLFLCTFFCESTNLAHMARFSSLWDVTSSARIANNWALVCAELHCFVLKASIRQANFQDYPPIYLLCITPQSNTLSSTK